ncbi:Na(+)/H(+) antiporter subunit B [Streptomyces sp. NBC_00388]|uniref:Na(+)/H(+) antiporter subunit B n=1 Tax=Streptomyces sp. NBC_00388 TaxID=2975735 RepID=UPI002E1EAE5E
MSGDAGGVDFLVAVSLLLVTVAATCAALTRDPVRQAVVLAALGLCLSVLFLAVQAPDVALSQLAVGSALTPLLVLLTVRKTRRMPRRDGRRDQEGPGGGDGGKGV